MAMTTILTPAVNISVEQIDEWKKQLDSISAEIERLTGLREQYARKLEAAAVLAGPIVASQLTDTSDYKAGTWTGEMLAVLKQQGKGLTFRQIYDELLKGPIAEQARGNPNGLYNAGERLLRAGAIVRHNGVVYLKAVYDALNEAGTLPTETEERATDVFKKALEDAGRPLSAGDLIATVKAASPIITAKIRKNPQYGYRVLSQMLMRKTFVRHGQLYALPSWKNETPPVGAEGVSEFTGEADISPGGLFGSRH